MSGDLISRSVLLKELQQSPWVADIQELQRILEHLPAVDAETYLDQLELVKEAFDMAKSSLAFVVRCKDCKWLYNGYDMYCCTKHTGLALIKPDGSSFCSYGERRGDNE